MKTETLVHERSSLSYPALIVTSLIAAAILTPTPDIPTFLLTWAVVLFISFVIAIPASKSRKIKSIKKPIFAGVSVVILGTIIAVVVIQIALRIGI
jgi:hypothetical protein